MGSGIGPNAIGWQGLGVKDSKEDRPGTEGGHVTDNAHSAMPTRFGEAVEAVYDYATSPYDWERLIDFLAHLDHDSFGSVGPSEASPALQAHMRRADALATRLHETDGVPEASYALILLSADRTVIALNERGADTFTAICRAPETGKRLAFHDDEHALILRHALDELKQHETAVPVLLRFQDDEGETKLACYLAPAARLSSAMLRTVVLDEKSSPPFCALIVANSAEEDDTPEMFRKALGLTPAEARLAVRLRFGLSLKEAAEDLGISVNTARNQLRNVFDKLGVNRQSDLVRHLTELAALASNIQGAPSSRSRAAVTTAERRMAPLPDGRVIAYRELGLTNGFPVFIINPMIVSSLMRPQEAQIAGECGARLISVERPGIGRSTVNPDYSYVSFAHDLAHVADGLGIDRFAVLGWASGSPFALAAGSVLGERVTRVALATPRLAFHIDMEPTSQPRLFFGSLRRNPWIHETVFSIMRAKRSQGFLRPLVRHLLETSDADKAVFQNDKGLLESLTDAFIEALDATSDGMIAEMDFYAREVPVDPSGLVRPLMVWQGLQDEMNNVDNVRRMLQGLPVEKVHYLDGVGHMVLYVRFREILTTLVNDVH